MKVAENFEAIDASLILWNNPRRIGYWNSMRVNDIPYINIERQEMLKATLDGDEEGFE